MDWKWIIGMVIAILGIVIMIWIYWKQTKAPEASLKKQLWDKIKDISNLKILHDFSKDRDFTLVLISYLNFARQVIAFSTPAPDALPSLLKSKYTFGQERDQGAENTIPNFWGARLKKLDLEDKNNLIWGAVKKKGKKRRKIY